jgi:hypothetical protein
MHAQNLLNHPLIAAQQQQQQQQQQQRLQTTTSRVAHNSQRLHNQTEASA